MQFSRCLMQKSFEELLLNSGLSAGLLVSLVLIVAGQFRLLFMEGKVCSEFRRNNPETTVFTDIYIEEVISFF